MERALNLSKNVLDKAKRDLGNNPLMGDPIVLRVVLPLLLFQLIALIICRKSELIRFQLSLSRQVNRHS